MCIRFVNTLQGPSHSKFAVGANFVPRHETTREALAGYVGRRFDPSHPVSL